ncbi:MULTISPECIES: hypothetical protein [Clostridium]|uniref:hypothetical protein n=1 Tax=Clostridium TaxID=1485 RepID=UPI001C0CE957|nr:MULTISPECIES: hypothetical protein [Clostridium]MBU3146944.1 hypothetical protein [Clostridium sp. CF012]MBU3179486.1 hypothetical protein [Clostridium estertheticum]MBX4264426.1 hypothetical protein [Clostridium estertheticum]MBX4271347.1 hypothetical protein [Clostridium estertheticum]WLC78241.1 hypothetical protein KTC98_13460 [Clostridium estertheticum]
MNKKNTEQKEFEEWHKMKSKGKKKYIWYSGVLKGGLSVAIPTSFIVQAIDGGINLYSFSNQNFIRRLIINIVVFSVSWCIYSIFLWRKYEKKYRYR